ncbi:MAG: tRNA lysidine(34) synthetase TilS [Candidatus Omnitrophica bacterium]|nr:tRNA lysidine(34) synthetase TilS [Candidatus Omnitrophota bacterium]
MTSFIDKVRDNINKHDLLSRGGRVLVAVSGGADSLALLYVLNELRHDFGFSLVIAHYNHALRSSAIRDQKFVKQVAQKLNIPFVTETNQKKPPQKGSLEEFARDIRYEFLLKTACSMKADTIAVAHTQDDLAETVLMRILRGTGLSGLRSMAFKRVVEGRVYIRPLLNIPRCEIESFLKKRRLSCIQDPTNRSIKFTRNKIRLRLIPYMKKEFSPDINTRLVSLANIACIDHDFIEEAGRLAWPRLVKIEKEEVVIKSSGFKTLHPALRRVLLRMAIGVLKGVERSWDFRHIDMIDTFVASRSFGKLSLPQGFVLNKAKGSKSFLIKNYEYHS